MSVTLVIIAVLASLALTGVCLAACLCPDQLPWRRRPEEEMRAVSFPLLHIEPPRRQRLPRVAVTTAPEQEEMTEVPAPEQEETTEEPAPEQGN